jgi:hypothetical protein
MMRGVILCLLLLLTAESCIVRHLVGGPRLTGTCDGACAHYVECKAGHSDRDRMRCQNECPDVFSDRDSLMAYESMTCKNAVEFVDGDGQRAATSRR